MFHYFRQPSNPQFILSPNDAPVAEFLYQLTKMLTDNNNQVIEWTNGRIVVHDPPRLASDILSKYFRHSKFSSFQRQLNYFGFRKLAGKGKMSPCSYVNDSTSMDIRSLMTIKRKTVRTTPSTDSNAVVVSSSDLSKSSNSLPNTSSSTTSSNSCSKRPLEIAFENQENITTSRSKRQKQVTISTVPSMVVYSSVNRVSDSGSSVSTSSTTNTNTNTPNTPITMSKFDNNINNSIPIPYPIAVSTCGMMYDCRCPIPCAPPLSLSPATTNTSTCNTVPSILPQQHKFINIPLQPSPPPPLPALLPNNFNNNISFDAAGFCNALNDAIRTFNGDDNEYASTTASNTPEIENITSTTNTEDNNTIIQNNNTINNEDNNSIMTFLNQYPSLNTTPIPQIIDNNNFNASYPWLVEPTPISEMYLNMT